MQRDATHTTHTAAGICRFIRSDRVAVLGRNVNLLYTKLQRATRASRFETSLCGMFPVGPRRRETRGDWFSDVCRVPLSGWGCRLGWEGDIWKVKKLGEDIIRVWWRISMHHIHAQCGCALLKERSIEFC